MNTPKEWFESWFDTHYYHILYKHRDDTEAHYFIDNLLDFLQPAADAHILDLACGKGRHARYIAQQAYQVVGVDLSPQSIDYASQFEAANLHFAVHDMRQVFRPQAFDYVFNFFTSFGYFNDVADNQKAITAMAQSLKPDGYVIIDFLNAQKVIDNLVPAEKKEIDGVLFDIERAYKDGFIYKYITVKDGASEHRFYERVQALNLADFKAYFEKSGLQIEQIWGDYALNVYDETSANRLILLGKMVM